VIVACDHSEGIRPGSKLRIVRLAPRSGFVPFLIDPIKPVAKQYPLRDRQAKSGVIDFYAPGVRRKLDISEIRMDFPIRDERTDHDPPQLVSCENLIQFTIVMLCPYSNIKSIRWT